jgi:hypothetical protein
MQTPQRLRELGENPRPVRNPPCQEDWPALGKIISNFLPPPV